jgi:hypothetical protein
MSWNLGLDKTKWVKYLWLMPSKCLEEFEFEEVDEDHREGVNTADFEPDGIMVTA